MRDYVNVSTQKELDEVLARDDIPICVGKGRFVAWESAHVVARESAHVVAWESAHVVAWESAHVVARESAHVVARGSAHVVARESAHVEAWESAHVVAWESAHVVARESAHVEARESAHVVASKFVGVHRHGNGSRVKGGVLIQVPEIKTMEDFCDWYGVEVKRGFGTFYKLVGDDFVSGHGTEYKPDSTARCDDFDGEARCGGGLHFSPRPALARRYSNGSRFVACKVKLADAVVVADAGQPDKIKARSCKVLCECDEQGAPVK